MQQTFDSSSFSLYEKLAEIRKLVEILQKNKKGGQGRYVEDSVILSKVTAGMQKYRVDVYPGIVPGSTEVVPVTYSKTKIVERQPVETSVHEKVVKGDSVYTWVDLDHPDQKLEIPWVVIGQHENASMALGAGLTYCMRYFLLKFFKASTSEDDPDAWRKDQQAATAEIEREAISDLIEAIDEYVKKISTDENREEIVEFIKTIVSYKGKPTANYNRIEDVATANKLLQELEKKYPIKKEKD